MTEYGGTVRTTGGAPGTRTAERPPGYGTVTAAPVRLAGPARPRHGRPRPERG